MLGHVEVSNRSNEIPVAQALIESMGLTGRVFTLDALHCQKNADACAGKGCGRTCEGQGKQPGLLAACEDLARHCTPPQCDVQHDKGHGRVGTRTVHAYDLPPDRLPEGRQPLVPQVARGSRTVGRRKAGGWHMTNETAWWIGTAVPEAPAFQCAIRGYRCVENQNHLVRDATLRADHCHGTSPAYSPACVP